MLLIHPLVPPKLRATIINTYTGKGIGKRVLGVYAGWISVFVDISQTFMDIRPILLSCRDLWST